MQFQNQANGSQSYLRIPLSTFAQDVTIAGGYKRCNIAITYVNEYPGAGSYIMLGGMFFHDFFTVF